LGLCYAKIFFLLKVGVVVGLLPTVCQLIVLC
jgi:hypothetical protein